MEVIKKRGGNVLNVVANGKLIFAEEQEKKINTILAVHIVLVKKFLQVLMILRLNIPMSPNNGIQRRIV